MNKKIIIIVVAIIIVVLAWVILVPKQKDENESVTTKTSSQKLTSVDSITHGHGIAIDVADPSNLYIATHHGLLLLKNDKELYQIGNAKDDYMGFSPHPNDPKIFFSSGHPETGGNIGFQISKDGGISWEKISDGVQGPVDFHAMGVSPVNPDLIYGWYQGAVQRSTDGGKNWEIVSRTSAPIVNFGADPKDENTLYAASSQGLMVSKNKAADWTTLIEGFVSVVAINPQDSQTLLSFSEKNRLARSTDGGENWEKLSETFSGETPLFISINKQNPEVVYTLTEKNSIYKSTDGGDSWNKVR